MMSIELKYPPSHRKNLNTYTSCGTSVVSIVSGTRPWLRSVAAAVQDTVATAQYTMPKRQLLNCLTSKPRIRGYSSVPQ